ncbi:MAG TPA: pilus assembly protein [Beijerinckiaceae bacterium]
MSVFRKFGGDRSGATAVLFGLAILPVMGFAGAAIDYGRASAAKAQLQQAVDAAALGLAREQATANKHELERHGRQIVKTQLKDAEGLTADRIEVTRSPKTIRVAVSARMKTAFMGLLGFSVLDIGSEAEAAWGTPDIELALVLDNTGSMAESPHGKRKIDELRKAAAGLLKDLRGVAKGKDSVKVSIVPFDTEVRLDPAHRNADWLRWERPTDRLDWTGYVEDRDQPYDTTAEAATADVKSKHRARRFSRYAGHDGRGNDIAAIRPLTSLSGKGYDALVDAVDEMRPRGNTNVGLGVAWGLATLARSAPFAGAPSEQGVKRFMIVLTDGDNTQSLVNGEVNRSARIIDERTRLACASAKKAATVYTIRLVEGNAALLRDCASDKDKYYDVTDPSKLEGVFRSIMKEISQTRLSV